MKYLILGDGKLATEIQKQTGWDVLSRKKFPSFDFCDIDSYKYEIEKYNVIINCIGYTQTYANERKLNWDVNFAAVIDLVEWCNRKKVKKLKLVHISTDYVYANSSTHPCLEEDIPVHYESWYAYTKLLADGYVQAKADNYLLIRTTFKPRPFPWESAWGDMHGNFDYVDNTATKIIELIRSSAKGVYNIGGTPKTYYDLALQTNPEVKEVKNAGNYPRNVLMDLTKYEDAVK